MWQEYHDLRQRDPLFEPARPVLPVYTRQPFGIAVPQPIITDALAHQVAELAAMAHELVLQLLNRFFTNTDETEQQLSTLIGAAISMMGGVLHRWRPRSPPCRRTAPSRQHGRIHLRGLLRPGQHGSLARTRMGPAPRTMALLTQRCAEITHAAPQAVHQAHQRAATLTATIAVHVPADLRPPLSTVST